MTIPEDPTVVLPLPQRKEARIHAVICTETLCFAAIPADRVEAHAKWHEVKRRAVTK